MTRTTRTDPETAAALAALGETARLNPDMPEDLRATPADPTRAIAAAVDILVRLTRGEFRLVRVADIAEEHALHRATMNALGEYLTRIAEAAGVEELALLDALRQAVEADAGGPTH